jgi:hypothetical protein
VDATYIISAQNADDFSVAVQLHEQALFHVLCRTLVSPWHGGAGHLEGCEQYLFQFGLSLRHDGDGELEMYLAGRIEGECCLGERVLDYRKGVLVETGEFRSPGAIRAIFQKLKRAAG